MLEKAVKDKTLVVDLDLFFPGQSRTRRPSPPSSGYSDALSAPVRRSCRSWPRRSAGSSASIAEASGHRRIGGKPSRRSGLRRVWLDVFLPAKVADKATMVDLLLKRSPPYVLENGKTVPKAYWNAWVPDDPKTGVLLGNLRGRCPGNDQYQLATRGRYRPPLKWDVGRDASERRRRRRGCQAVAGLSRPHRGRRPGPTPVSPLCSGRPA